MLFILPYPMQYTYIGKATIKRIYLHDTGSRARMRIKTLLGVDNNCFVVETGSLMFSALFYVVWWEESPGSMFLCYQLGSKC